MFKWYDSLKEPKRFLVFFIPAIILIVGINVPYPTINYISGGLLLMALVVRLDYIHRKRKER